MDVWSSIMDLWSSIYDKYYRPMVKDPVLNVKCKIDKDEKFSIQFPWQARPTLVPWRGCNLVEGLLSDIDIQTCDEEADGGVVSVPFDILHDHGTLLHRQVLDVPCQITTDGEEVTANRVLLSKIFICTVHLLPTRLRILGWTLMQATLSFFSWLIFHTFLMKWETNLLL